MPGGWRYCRSLMIRSTDNRLIMFPLIRCVERFVAACSSAGWHLGGPRGQGTIYAQHLTVWFLALRHATCSFARCLTPGSRSSSSKTRSLIWLEMTAFQVGPFGCWKWSSFTGTTCRLPLCRCWRCRSKESSRFEERVIPIDTCSLLDPGFGWWKDCFRRCLHFSCLPRPAPVRMIYCPAFDEESPLVTGCATSDTFGSYPGPDAHFLARVWETHNHWPDCGLSLAHRRYFLRDGGG